MNEHILESAAVYVNAYRNACEKRGFTLCKATLRRHIETKFGAIYAAILCQ